MRGAVVAAPGVVRLERVPLPQPAEGEVLVRLEGCGVCGSSLPVWQGRPWFRYPLPAGSPGHEAWGELERGGRVAVLTERGFAEWAVVPRESVVPLPAALDGLPFPGEALACAVNVFRRSAVRAGDTVAVVGVGFLGSAVALLCARAGAEVVRVRRGTEVEALAERCARVIEAAGTQSALDTASGLVAEGGRLVIAGFHQDGPRTVDLQSWNWRGIDVVNAHERDPLVYVEGMRSAAALAATGDLDLEALVTHRFSLASVRAAFEAAHSRPPGFVKAWVAP